MLLQPYTATFQDQMGSRGSLARKSWNELFVNYRRQYPDLADAMDRMHRGEMPGDWQSALPVFPADAKGIATRDSSGMVLNDAPDAKPDVLLLATGSEVPLCVAAQEQLALEGIQARVVSMPSWELFENQTVEYRNSVLPPEITARVSVEEASTFGWERYAGALGTMIGIDTFGLSAPIKVVQRHFGFTPEHVVDAARKQVTHQGA